MFDAVKAGILASTLLLAACSSSSGASGPATAASSGGVVGGACAIEGALGCAPGAKAKVKCQSGQWIDDGACGSGETCSETKQNGSVTATACAIPPSSNASRAIACAKASACLGAMDFGDCMTPVTPTIWAGLWHAMGFGLPQNLVPLEFDSRSGCIGAAKDCAGVRACFASGVPACQSDSDSACFGTVARVCENGATMAVDCAKISLPCATIGTETFCGNLPSCSTPGTIQCQGNKAHLCVGDKSGGAVSLVVDCNVLGGQCDPTAKATKPDGVCNGGAPTCNVLGFKQNCQGTRLTQCKIDAEGQAGDGHVLVQDCATYGQVCEFKSDSNAAGGGKATCTSTPNCAGEVGCKDGVMHYCEGSTGMHSFSCATAGMVCGTSGECEFGP